MKSTRSIEIGNPGQILLLIEQSLRQKEWIKPDEFLIQVNCTNGNLLVGNKEALSDAQRRLYPFNTKKNPFDWKKSMEEFHKKLNK